MCFLRMMLHSNIFTIICFPFNSRKKKKKKEGKVEKNCFYFDSPKKSVDSGKHAKLTLWKKVNCKNKIQISVYEKESEIILKFQL